MDDLRKWCNNFDLLLSDFSARQFKSDSDDKGIRVVLLGDYTIKQLQIDPETYEKSSPKELSQLVKDTVNATIKKVASQMRDEILALGGVDFDEAAAARIQPLAERFLAVQAALAEEAVERTGCDARIRVAVFGNRQIKRIHLNSDLYQELDARSMADEIRLVLNDALKKAGQLAERRIKGLAGGIHTSR